MFVKYDEYVQMQKKEQEEMKAKVFQNMEELQGEDIEGGGTVSTIITIITKLLSNPAIFTAIAEIIKFLVTLLRKGIEALIDLISGLFDKKKEQMPATC